MIESAAFESATENGWAIRDNISFKDSLKERTMYCRPVFYHESACILYTY